MISFFKKFRLLKHVLFEDSSSEIWVSKDTKLHFGRNSKIIIKPGSRFYFGHVQNGANKFPTRSGCLLTLGENATLIVEGDVSIGPGSAVILSNNAIATFGGNNVIAHDFLLMVRNAFLMGRNTSVSWNVTLVDDDGHANDIVLANGKKARRFNPKINIGNNVGIQMNVVMPAGKFIGDNSILAANLVVRSNIPQDTLAYQKSELKLKKGVRCAIPE